MKYVGILAGVAASICSAASAQAEKPVATVCAELQRPITGLKTTAQGDKKALERLGDYNKIAAQKLSGTSAADELPKYDEARAALVGELDRFVQASDRLTAELQKCAR